MFGRFISSRINYIILLFIIYASIAIVWYLYGLNIDIYLYILELGLTIIVFFGIADYIMFYRKYNTVAAAITENEVYDIAYNPTGNELELMYQELVNKLLSDNVQLRENNLKSLTELKEYYAIWAHQVKTPIAAMNLLLQVTNADTYEGDVKEIKDQLFRIDFYVDAVMNYLRLDDLSSDFKFAKYSLDIIVKKEVKKFAQFFINKNIAIELEELKVSVITDEKWLRFIIGQLLSNALKYTENGGKIRIYMRNTFNVNDVVLVIEDNGIGISKEDIPRIFECGYTGYNGRMDKKSTGIGLYLCKKAADKLGNSISIESESGKGTKAILDLTQMHTIHE